MDRAGKPTHEESEQRIEESQKAVLEGKSSAEVFRESDHKYRVLFEMAKDAIFVSDHTGRFVDVNQAACESLGYSKEELLNLSIKDINADPRGYEAFLKARDGQETKVTFEVNQRRKDGTLLPVEITGNFFESAGRRMAMAIVRNLTERKRAEQALRQLERESTVRNRIAQVFLTAPDDKMYGKVLRIVLEATESKYGVFGYIDEDGGLVCPSMTRDIWDQCQIPDKGIRFPRETWGGIWGKALIHKQSLYSNKPFRVPEGHISVLRALDVPIVHHHQVIGNLLVGNKETDYDDEDRDFLETIAGHIAPILHARMQRDSQEKERKRAEEALRESEEMFRLTFENAVDAIIWAEPDTGLVTNCNKAAETLLEKRKDEIIGQHQTKLHPPQQAEYYREMFKKHIERKGCFDDEAQVVTKFGKIIPVHITASVTLVGGKPIIQGIFRDITERKRAEEQIKASLKEKDLLLREIHHRVKNNMQVIASLLKMQCRHVKDDRVKALLEESENRVNAMVLVQELLYQSDSLAEIDLKKYISKLVDSIFRGCRLGGQVTWKSEVEAVTLSIDQAAPLALAFSEILTNSLKHGFPQGGPGKITVRSRLLENEQMELVIRDDGSGLPERIDIRNSKTLGLRLVKGLVENQLGGVVELSRKRGTQFTIRFPRKAALG